MILTDEQRVAANYDGNTFIVACPGSGKTRTLIAKMLRALNDVRDTSRKIACITYTNSAVYEIENRLKIFGKCGDDNYCDISTIHSFCLVNILFPFYWKIPKYHNGFTVLTIDSEEYKRIARDCLAIFGLPNRFLDQFDNLYRNSDGTPLQTGVLSPDLVSYFWGKLEELSYIDFPNIIYHSYKLVENNPSIAHTLACKYHWYLIDEFQDTTELQVKILQKIVSFGLSSFFLVGDPFQSIYGFAGARTDLMNHFAQEIAANTDFKILGNFRSSQRIVSHAERLSPRIPPMLAVGVDQAYQREPIYIHTQTTYEAIVDYFLPEIDNLGIAYGECAILSPWWFKLLPLARQLREYGLPVVGPGARPYKRTHLFANLAEQVCGYISRNSTKLLHQIEKELLLLIKIITGKFPYDLYSFEGRVVSQKLIYEGKRLYLEIASAVEWLNQASIVFSDVLIEEGLISPGQRNDLSDSVSGMLEDMEKNKVDLANLRVEELGMFADPESSIKLFTMHKAKGHEFDAVAIIDLHEGKVPDYRAINSGDLEKIEEGRRLLYVSLTRAKKLLMYITDQEHPKNQPSRFISEDYLNLSRDN